MPRKLQNEFDNLIMPNLRNEIVLGHSNFTFFLKLADYYRSNSNSNPVRIVSSDLPLEIEASILRLQNKAKPDSNPQVALVNHLKAAILLWSNYTTPKVFNKKNKANAVFSQSYKITVPLSIYQLKRKHKNIQ